MLHLHSSAHKPVESQKLGEILETAYLITPTQLEEALREQSDKPYKKLGEIIAAKGWLKQETADFFAGKWKSLIEQTHKQPLGYYLQQAGLLDQNQIETIVSEQQEQRMWVRLGTMAVLKGWLAQTTVDYFLENLYPEEAGRSPFLKAQNERSKQFLEAV
ncbi:MAG: hypothetical protein N5P05_003346 [Chroococcopsis gigantea SAG 12.99]|jgi:hypothetical protein|nr:hypothetical protein [Chlorogloea purpurea SAG 13.99]MDV3001740.1 hypothetical protein [Chroococcopsis gigantea SAG 12.99]